LQEEVRDGEAMLAMLAINAAHASVQQLEEEEDN
jgi:hypothetical protein